MREKQENNKVIPFSKKTVEFGNKVSEETKITFEHLNFLKQLVDLDKTISNDEKEKALAIINIVKNIESDGKKAETLKEFVKSNDRTEIINKIIYAVKYLSGTFAIIVVSILLNQNND